MKNNHQNSTRKLDQKIRWLFVFSLVAFVCFMGILYQQKNSQENARREVYNNYTIINKLEKFNTLVVEAESAARGYLISRDTVWKKTMSRLHDQLFQTIVEFKQLTQNSAAEQEKAKALELLALKK